MGEMNRTKLEAALRRYYASQRKQSDDGKIDQLARAMVAEDKRIGRAGCRRMGLASFVVAQVRFVPAWTWAGQIALVALMCAVARSVVDATAAKVSVGMLSAMTVLVGVPTVHASKLHCLAELEYSCSNNVASVMIARLVILGCSASLAVAIMVGATATSLEASAFSVALWSAPPFFLSCAGSLMALRKAIPSVASILCVAWTAVCSAIILALASALPDMYTQASLAIWAAAAAAACLWLVREIAKTFHAVSAGLDAFSPHMAKTNN